MVNVPGPAAPDGRPPAGRPAGQLTGGRRVKQQTRVAASDLDLVRAGYERSAMGLMMVRAKSGEVMIEVDRALITDEFLRPGRS